MKTYQNILSVQELQEGDIVKNKTGGSKPAVVVASFGERATAVINCDITNPGEWMVLRDEDPNQLDIFSQTKEAK
jgi:hypothetical protein